MKVISVVTSAGLTGLLMFSVLSIHSGAAHAQQPAEAAAAPVQGQAQAAPQAQQAPQSQQAPQYLPPPPPGGGYSAPQGYGSPPSNYGAPPPRYSYYPPPPPPMAQTTSERNFTIGGSLGLGAMRFYDYDNFQPASAPATGYSARLGFGVGSRLLLLIGVDGAVSSENDLVYDQSIYYLGLQGFLSQKLFLRGGAGIGNITAKDNWGDFLYFGKTGLGLTGTVGVELLQGYNWSLELAGLVTAGLYEDERWPSGTVQIGFNFF